VKNPSAIDWNDPAEKVSEFFTVHEALWLPSWRVYHEPSTADQERIVTFATRMDAVREFLDTPIIVHVWTRPLEARVPGSKWDGHNYNAYIGSTSTKSAHIPGGAMDWHASGYGGPEKCREIRSRLIPNLEEFGLRMEDIHGGWIHTDDNPVGINRFFKP